MFPKRSIWHKSNWPQATSLLCVTTDGTPAELNHELSRPSEARMCCKPRPAGALQTKTRMLLNCHESTAAYTFSIACPLCFTKLYALSADLSRCVLTCLYLRAKTPPLRSPRTDVVSLDKIPYVLSTLSRRPRQFRRGIASCLTASSFRLMRARRARFTALSSLRSDRLSSASG